MHIVVAPMTAQPSPPEQARPLQHGCPLPPQVTHLPGVLVPASASAAWQASPLPHPLRPLQQA
jgi:hypothetical protein